MLTLYTFNLKDLNSHLRIILQNDFQNPKLSLLYYFHKYNRNCWPVGINPESISFGFIPSNIDFMYV